MSSEDNIDTKLSSRLTLLFININRQIKWIMLKNITTVKLAQNSSIWQRKFPISSWNKHKDINWFKPVLDEEFTDRKKDNKFLLTKV